MKLKEIGVRAAGFIAGCLITAALVSVDAASWEAVQHSYGLWGYMSFWGQVTTMLYSGFWVIAVVITGLAALLTGVLPCIDYSLDDTLHTIRESH